MQRRGSEAALPIGSRRKRTPSTSSYGGDEPFLVRGVVLAPFDTRYNAETATRGGVDVIFGADALALLGGLQQAVYQPIIRDED